MSWAIFGLVLFLPYGVRGTLTPNGTVALDCGGQQEFTCDVSDITTGVALAGWRIDRLFNITAPGINGLRVANDNIRVTTTTGGNVPRSTITIANFDMRDNGGTVQCINTDDSTIQGTATISVAIPSCTSITANNDLNDECTSATVNWQHSLSNTPLVTSVTVTYCPTSSPNCGNSMKCTASPCTITGLTPIEDHYLTVIPNNNCGSPTGCTGNIPTRGLPSCPTNFSADRDGDFTNATVTYEQSTPPPVTSTTVTYCPTSSPNCGNSMNCTSPCTISGLNACEDYQLTVDPNNNCGSPTGCTGNSVNVTSQGIAACANNVTATRSGDFTNATIEWKQTTPPKVTFTTVTYSPILSKFNGENSLICMNSPCTISGLDPCMGYVFEVIPNNDCGNTTTGCTGNSAVTNSQGVPSCPSNTKSIYSDSNRNKATVTWQQPLNTPPVTSTTVTYCPTSSPNCGDNTTCTTTGTCTISGLDPGTEYQFTVIPNNNCGSPTGCTGNMATATRAESLLVLLALLALLLIPLMYPLGVLIAWRCCYKDKSYCEVFWCCWCCGCCAGGKSGRNSTEPMKSPTGDDDAQDKTGQKEEKLTYAALEFSEQAGSTGEKKVRSHEEPVQYAAVDHA